MSTKRRIFCAAFGALGIYLGYKNLEMGAQYIVGALLDVDPTE